MRYWSLQSISSRMQYIIKTTEYVQIMYGLTDPSHRKIYLNKNDFSPVPPSQCNLNCNCCFRCFCLFLLDVGLLIKSYIVCNRNTKYLHHALNTELCCFLGREVCFIYRFTNSSFFFPHNKDHLKIFQTADFICRSQEVASCQVFIHPKLYTYHPTSI